MASKLFLVVAFAFNLVTFASAVAPEQRRTRPQCHDNESLALLQFKDSLRVDCFASSHPFAYPKVSSWKPKRSDCCGWHGVKCDEDTGYVVSLHLSSSCLFGPINSNSSLFQLFYLQKLSLADNWFNDSQIPAGFRQLSRLTNLNLSYSLFSGQITTEILELSDLVSLDLSRNTLELSKPGLQSMAQNLTKLKELHLSQVNMSFTIPKILANLSSLTSLLLRDCGLHGEFPIEIFHLPNLKSLDVSNNVDLDMSKLEFNQSSPLKSLDLSSTNFSGKLPNSISNLTFLQHISVVGCNFYGIIPSSFGNLAHLVSLKLFENGFYGVFPIDIFHLPNLKYLDVSYNSNLSVSMPDFNRSNALESLDLSGTSFLGKFPNSISNLTFLQHISVVRCNFFGTIPSSFGNLAHLVSLELFENRFYGVFPIDIFHLPNLKYIDVSYNSNLNVSMPDFNQSNALESLDLSGTSFSGKLPNSISNLTFLQCISVVGCNFFGIIPSSFGNLANLVSLKLSKNRFYGVFPTSIFHLPNLRWIEVEFNENLTLGLPEFNKSSPLESLYISGTPFSSKLPHSISYLKSLFSFVASGCNISGPMLYSLGNLTQLIKLDLRGNNLHGSIPESISRLVNLEYLDLDSTYLSGIVELDLFLKLKKLHTINLSNNNISWVTKTSTNATFPKFKTLFLSYCHLSEFPNFLKNQDQLEELDLSRNRISGQVPKWMWKVTKDTLWSLDLSFNFLTGFDEFPIFSSSSKLLILKLDSNKLQGPLLIPPPSIILYSAANNTLTGDIQHWICNLSSIVALDLSSNNLNGLLPKCLGNLSSSILVLNLNENKFHGTLPQSFIEGNTLKMIDLSQNQLQGPMPRSLANCTELEVLNLGDNQINGSFPFWLGGLSKLKVLILRSNGFHGAIQNPSTRFDFPSLRVIDISNNMITGELPFQYFQTWKAMQILNETSLTYMQTYTSGGYYNYSMTFINKGEKMKYARILDFFMAIDLSNNSFKGEIPKVIGHLKGLKLLNLSNNFLIGHIPFSLGNLMELESLDLSQNKLSGAIPLQLVQLNFLAFFNVSHNNLTGLIPSGNQFNTFLNASFGDNPGLCGSPLSTKCENFEHSHSPTSTFGDSQACRYLFEFRWKVVVMGYGCGFVFGLVLGIIKKHDWFMKTFVVG